MPRTIVLLTFWSFLNIDTTYCASRVEEKSTIGYLSSSLLADKTKLSSTFTRKLNFHPLSQEKLPLLK